MFVAFFIKYNCYKQYYKAHLTLRQRFVPVASLTICLHECMNGHIIFNHVIRYQSLCFLPLTLNTDVVSTKYTKTTQNKNGTNIIDLNLIIIFKHLPLILLLKSAILAIFIKDGFFAKEIILK